MLARQRLTDCKSIGCRFDSTKKMRHDDTRYSDEAYFVRRPFLSFVSRTFNRQLAIGSSEHRKSRSTE